MSPCVTVRCAQSEHNHRDPIKVDDPAKHRAKRSADCFNCRGALKLVVADNSDRVALSYRHEVDHVEYKSIGLPNDVISVIEGSLDKTPHQVWTAVRKLYPEPKFKRATVLARVRDIHSKQWREDPRDDQLTSARKVLSRATKDLGPHPVEEITLPSHSGYSAVAFCVPSILSKWKSRIREILLDSTWQTNGENYELYVILGEAYGSGVPLAFLLIKVKGPNIPLTKAEYLSAVLLHLVERYRMKINNVHIDKDLTEICSCGHSVPHADHQLCFWHALRAVKKRLAILRRAPAFYDAEYAVKIFSWVDKTFIPVGQGGVENYVPSQTLPIVNVRFGGKLVPHNVPEPPIATPTSTPAANPVPSQPSNDSRSTSGCVRLTITIPAACGDATIPATTESAPPKQSEPETFMEGEMTEDSAELWEKFEKNIAMVEEDQEDGPDWMFESDEKPVKTYKYTFCPAQHRKGALRLFTKHFCQHPLLPDQAGKHTKEQIYEAATREMYGYCAQRGLSEVWAYMWNSWYRPSHWKLWARSATKDGRISRLRTTMAAENFFQQLKHNSLHYYHRPRLDHLIWVIVTDIIPNYMQRASVLEDTHLLGRAKALTPRQKTLKQEWEKLARRRCESGRTYVVNVREWTCNCGQQKYSPHLLCKHLVNAVPAPSPNFWAEICIRRTTPFYRHCEIRPKNEHPGWAKEPTDGSISDGDDHVFSDGMRDLLRDRGALDETLKKRKRELESEEDKENVRPGCAPEAVVADHHHHQSDALRMPLGQSVVSNQVQTNIPIDPCLLDLEDELPDIAEYEALVNDLSFVTEALRSQLPHPSTLFAATVARELGPKIRGFAQEIRRKESTGRHMPLTWDSHNRLSMGYRSRPPARE